MGLHLPLQHSKDAAHPNGGGKPHETPPQGLGQGGLVSGAFLGIDLEHFTRFPIGDVQVADATVQHGFVLLGNRRLVIGHTS